jgi:hypothetical protein
LAALVLESEIQKRKQKQKQKKTKKKKFFDAKSQHKPPAGSWDSFCRSASLPACLERTEKDLHLISNL